MKRKKKRALESPLTKTLHDLHRSFLAVVEELWRKKNNYACVVCGKPGEVLMPVNTDASWYTRFTAANYVPMCDLCTTIVGDIGSNASVMDRIYELTEGAVVEAWRHHCSPARMTMVDVWLLGKTIWDLAKVYGVEIPAMAWWDELGPLVDAMPRGSLVGLLDEKWAELLDARKIRALMAKRSK